MVGKDVKPTRKCPRSCDEIEKVSETNGVTGAGSAQQFQLGVTVTCGCAQKTCTQGGWLLPYLTRKFTCLQVLQSISMN